MFYYRVEIDGVDFTAPFTGQVSDYEYRDEITPAITVTCTLIRDTALAVTKGQVTVQNQGQQPVMVSRADFGWRLPVSACTVQYFTSHWGSEFSPARKKITDLFTFGTYSGRSSNGCDPWMGLETDAGYASATVAWSGNWDARVLPLEEGGYLASMGISSWKFSHQLAPGESFSGADVYLTDTESEMELSCHHLRQYFKKHISIVDNTQQSLPFPYNSWWPHEDKTINEAVMLSNAEVAAQVGCTHATMDAGWFGDNQNWVQTRGDWEVVNQERFPSGMAALGRQIQSLNLGFGLWCEIEAVGPRAQLNQTRPELIARRDGESLGYICMGNPDSRAWAKGILTTIIQQYGASWIKLDFNLDPGQGCGCTAHGHGRDDGVYAHYLGFTQLLSEIRREHPHVIFEDCSSGGLRIDYMSLRNHHYVFLSDPDYTEHHLQCFWGATSMIHPSSCFHFSWSQTLIRDNIDREPIQEQMPQSKFDYIIRAALTGVPALSYRLVDFPEWCRARLKEHISFYQAHSAKYILHGEMYRLTGQPLRGGMGERWAAFQYRAEDDSHIVFVFRLQEGESKRVLYPRTLSPDRIYQVSFEDGSAVYTMSGCELAGHGIMISHLPEEGSDIICIRPVGQ